MKLLALLILLFGGVISSANAGGGYKNFKVAVYARAYEVQKMDSLQWLDQVWDSLSHQVHVDKIYLETHPQEIPVRMEGPSQVSLIVYDNGTSIVESFLPESAAVKIVAGKNVRVLEDISTGKKYTGMAVESRPIWGRSREAAVRFDVRLDPHSYIVFRAE